MHNIFFQIKHYNKQQQKYINTPQNLSHPKVHYKAKLYTSESSLKDNTKSFTYVQDGNIIHKFYISEDL